MTKTTEYTRGVIAITDMARGMNAKMQPGRVTREGVKVVVESYWKN